EGFEEQRDQGSKGTRPGMYTVHEDRETAADAEICRSAEASSPEYGR
ncbi:hypothetical protein JOD43_002740, partial [Pullulanibacillus pueri]|nr:hypothetical protein [Pullulanibacillus pueri]